jgi:hypothetical protein
MLSMANDANVASTIIFIIDPLFLISVHGCCRAPIRLLVAAPLTLKRFPFTLETIQKSRNEEVPELIAAGSVFRNALHK